jgi:hypothetical protein
VKDANVLRAKTARLEASSLPWSALLSRTSDRMTTSSKANCDYTARLSLLEDHYFHSCFDGGNRIFITKTIPASAIILTKKSSFVTN